MSPGIIYGSSKECMKYVTIFLSTPINITCAMLLFTHGETSHAKSKFNDFDCVEYYVLFHLYLPLISGHQLSVVCYFYCLYLPIQSAL